MLNWWIAGFVIGWFYVYVSSQIRIKNAGLELSYTVTEFNYCLEDESRLQLYVGRHLDDCITACALRPHCEALTYRPFGSSSMCELFQTEGRENNVKRTGCVYIQKRDMPINKSPCAGECENGTTCIVETKSCNYTECINLPNITNGKILGNLRAVGNKIQLTCDVGKRTVRQAVCQSNGTWSVTSQNCIKPEDCKDVHDAGILYSGVYRIFPVGSGHEGIKVRCDMNTPPGGWTIIQRRVDDTDFYKNWTQYKLGFGDLLGSFWLGNDLIWKLTSQKHYRLRIDLTAQDGITEHVDYEHFSIANEAMEYALSVSGFLGNDSVGDSLTIHDKITFSTWDIHKYNNKNVNCAIRFHGAWWYKQDGCHRTNLNGHYLNNEFGMGLTWETWRGQEESMKATEMKIYPGTASLV